MHIHKQGTTSINFIDINKRNHFILFLVFFDIFFCCTKLIKYLTKITVNNYRIRFCDALILDIFYIIKII